MDRDQWITRISILIAFLLFGMGILLSRRESRIGQAQIGQREPLPSLGYCSTGQVGPCILSFNLDLDGKMVINILTNRSSPDFYLKIKRDEIENTYDCQRTKGFLNTVSCTGETVPLGVAFQFLILSTNEDILLAEGRFQVIGLALATPEIYSTPTRSHPPGKPPR